MKKIYNLTLVALTALSLAACSSQSSAPAESTTVAETSAETAVTSADESVTEAAETTAEAPAAVTISTLDGNREPIELEVPYNPERIAVLDLASLDILDSLGMGDRVVGVTKGNSIDYIDQYMSNDDILNLGTIKEADLEAVMESDPDVIFIGGRLASVYDALAEIAPVVLLATDTEAGVVKSVETNAMMIASMFGAEAQVADLLAGYEARIDKLAAAAEGKTAIIGLVTSGGFNILGNDGRCSLIGREIGYENLGNADETSTHGNESSFELLVEVEPDYIFVLDRDAAIAAEGAKLAQEIVENELVMMTSAYENGNIVYLENPKVWYMAEGGIKALDIMLADLEAGLLK